MSEAFRALFVSNLLQPGTTCVRFSTLQETHDFLTLRQRFRLVDTDRMGLGYHLFYVRNDILVRIKTHGDSTGHPNWRDRAQLSVALWLGHLDYKDPRDPNKGEWAKFTPQGIAVAPPLPSDHKARDLWAKATHFSFPVKQLPGGEKLWRKHGTA